MNCLEKEGDFLEFMTKGLRKGQGVCRLKPWIAGWSNCDMISDARGLTTLCKRICSALQRIGLQGEHSPLKRKCHSCQRLALEEERSLKNRHPVDCRRQSLTSNTCKLHTGCRSAAVILRIVVLSQKMSKIWSKAEHQHGPYAGLNDISNDARADCNSLNCCQVENRQPENLHQAVGKMLAHVQGSMPTCTSIMQTLRLC